MIIADKTQKHRSVIGLVNTGFQKGQNNPVSMKIDRAERRNAA
jgi:hypothetical protein